jgi:biopolymer transport protein ExbD
MKLPPPDHDGEGINLTPVIDVVFLLLIFFLVATRFDQEERELSPTLPEVLEAQPVSSPPQELVVNITPEGKYIVMRRTLSEAELARLLREAGRKNPGTQSVLVRGDAKVAWELGVKVMGMCAAAGIDDYRVAALQTRGN